MQSRNEQPSDSVLLLAKALQAVIDDTVQASEERMMALVENHRHLRSGEVEIQMSRGARA